jgi:hypothetical protein
VAKRAAAAVAARILRAGWMGFGRVTGSDAKGLNSVCAEARFLPVETLTSPADPRDRLPRFRCTVGRVHPQATVPSVP